MEQVSSLKTGERYKDTPIGKVPVDWEVVTINDICKIRRGASPRPIGDSSFFSKTGRGWIRIADVTSTYKHLKKTIQCLSEKGVSKSVKVDPGDLIMSICATIGKPVIVDIEACIHDGFVLFAELSQKINKEYLFYFLQKIEKQIAVKGQIGTQGNLNTNIVRKTSFPLPPLQEQKKIAQIISTLDDAIEKTTQIIETTKDLKKGLMQKLFTEGIGHTRFKKTKIGRIPEEWGIGKLSGIALVTMGQSPLGNTYNSDGVGVPMLNGPTEFTDYSPIPVQYTTKPTKLCKSGDILICVCLLYTSPSPRDRQKSRMPSSA